MNKILLIILALCTFSIPTFSQGGEDLQAAEFHKQITKTESSFQLVDVRTPGEFNSGHIEGAENFDFNDRHFITEINTLDKNKPTYIYCRSGGRSAGAMEDMLKEGFTKVYNMEGGIKAWNEANLPITNSLASLSGLSKKEFDEMTNQDLPVLVDFTATWCGPCRLMKPDISKLAKNYPKDVKVIYIDVDENKDLINEIGIQAMPTLHLYKKGRFIRKQVGLISYDELKRFIR